MSDDRRGVSTPVSYTLTLSIALVLVSGLLIGGTTLVGDQRDRTMQSQLSTIGEGVAGSFETADRLVNSSESEPSNLELVRTTPDDVIGAGYAINVRGQDELQIFSASEDVSVTVSMDLDTNVREGAQVPGGRFVIRYDDADGLVIEDE